MENEDTALHEAVRFGDIEEVNYFFSNIFSTLITHYHAHYHAHNHDLNTTGFNFFLLTTK